MVRQTKLASKIALLGKVLIAVSLTLATSACVEEADKNPSTNSGVEANNTSSQNTNNATTVDMNNATTVENNMTSPNSESPGCLVDSETGECAPEDLSSVHMTHLQIDYDLSKVIYVNNRVPVRFGLTGTRAGESSPATEDVTVAFSFIEAEPANAEEPIECESNSLTLELPMDGAEHQFDGIVWPTSLCYDLVGKKVGLRVRFNGGAEIDEEQPRTISAPTVTLTDALAGSKLNQLCSGANGENKGCVYPISLSDTPTADGEVLIDVLYPALDSESSVAILPLAPTGEEDITPSLSVSSTLVMNGRDPYINGASAEEVPESLEAAEPGITEELRFGLDPDNIDAFEKLPGVATLRYEIALASSPEDAMPLMISETDVDGSQKLSRSSLVENIAPGSPNTFDHDLIIEGDTRQAIESGRWSSESNFVVRGCFDAEFTQRGNEGYLVDNGDCQEKQVMLVRQQPSESAAASFTFNKSFDKSAGNSRMKIKMGLSTENSLDANGLRSRVRAGLDFNGKVGKSFNLTIAEAFGEAVLNKGVAGSNYEVGVVVLNQTLYSVADEISDTYTNENEFSAGRSLNLPGIGFGFGPVRIGLSFKVGGEAGFGTADELRFISDNLECQTELGTQEDYAACGKMSRTAGPFFAFTVDIDGGINLRVVKAGIRVELKLARLDLPLSATLLFGAEQDGGVVVQGNTTLETVFRLIAGKVKIYGKIGFRRWAKRVTVTIATFASKEIRNTLLSKDSGGLQLLDSL